MSLSSALSGALSGLTASSRAADIVSANLANVLTKGYGPRSLELVSRTDGTGVSVGGVVRDVNLRLVQDRRMADSETSYAGARADAVRQVESLLGTPDEPGSLSAQLADFGASLVTAANRPEAVGRLQAAVSRAGDLAAKFKDISTGIQDMRSRADADIGHAVNAMQAELNNIEQLNRQITSARASGRGTEGLEDTRQSAIDRLAEFVPVRQVPRANGMIALFTPGGATLIDGLAATLEFTSTGVIAPHMTADNGLLSGLTLNGRAVETLGPGSVLGGGKLAAHFAIRDDIGVDAQAELDALAADLVTRFQDIGPDATRMPGSAGLYTDAGAAFDPADEVGLSGRLGINTVVDPASGGEVWRMRDGLGAASPGIAGNGALLNHFATALDTPSTLSSGGGARSLSGHLAGLSSHFGQMRISADRAISFASARQGELTQLELQGGVDTDAELQRLLLVEQSYSANARMIQTVDEMLQTLMGI